MATLAAVDRDQLVRDGMKYVHGIAWGLRNQHVDHDDLVSYGYRGLLKAAERFDPTMGQFGTFSLPHIRGAMLDGVRREDPFGRRTRRAYAMIDRARYRYAAREHRFPTSPQLAAELGWTADELSAVQQKARLATTSSLDFELPVVDPTESLATLADTIAHPDADTQAQALARIDRDELSRMIARLPARERTAIVLRFWEDMRTQEIADVLGVTESRISQLIARALERLRAMRLVA